jgi:hypothetical protein
MLDLGEDRCLGYFQLPNHPGLATYSAIAAVLARVVRSKYSAIAAVLARLCSEIIVCCIYAVFSEFAEWVKDIVLFSCFCL